MLKYSSVSLVILSSMNEVAYTAQITEKSIENNSLNFGAAASRGGQDLSGASKSRNETKRKPRPQ